jgi:ferredoxin
LLVVNSRGINVWCAASGGHLTTYDVISALKLMGVAESVDHRQVILPQLAATGVEIERVREASGWDVIWGPVYVEDLPAFLNGEGVPGMREVRFGIRDRLEMAVMWAAPLSLLALVTLIFWGGGFLALLALIWGLALAVYCAFPIYEGLVRLRALARLVALFWSLTVLCTFIIGALWGRLSLAFVLRWSALGLATVFLLVLDLAGSTPLFKSWSHQERGYNVRLDVKRCIACGRCAQVCPAGVFVVSSTASMSYRERCQQCGACIVQCPVDALAFAAPGGGRVPPEDIRRYKLNLMGRRRSVADATKSAHPVGKDGDR